MAVQVMVTQTGVHAYRALGATSAGSYIKDDEVEEDHEGMEDKACDVLQLSNHGLCVLESERQVLAFL